MIRRISILFILFTAIGIQQVQSQVLIGLLFGEKLNKGPIEFGLDLIVNYSETTIDNGSDPTRRLGFGLYMDYKFNQNFILSGSFFFASPKGEENFDERDPLYRLADSLLAGANTSRQLNYFEFPLMIEYRAFQSIGLGFGGYLSYLTSAHDEYQVSGDNGDITNRRSVIGEFNRLDYGLMAGLHYHFKGDPGSQIQLTYMRGLADLLRDGNSGQGYNEVFQIGVMIPIKFGVLPDGSSQQENSNP